MAFLMRASALLCLFLVGCGDDAVVVRDFLVRGASPVGVATISATDASRMRSLEVEIWYPAGTSTTASVVLDFETDAAKRGVLSGLLENAPADCVATETDASRDAPADGLAHPLVLYSHCHNCTRWSAHSVMERLASHGFVVVSPDHTGNTLFDSLSGPSLPLDSELVAAREADIRFLLDEIIAGRLLPAGVSVDQNRVGMLGHSIGSVTAGAVAQNDSRIRAVLGMAAPMENPLFPGIAVSAITVPIGMLVATEDNSVGEAGNLFTRNNFDNANLPAYKLELIDAGHWSVTNIAGITEFFAPGCGDGTRQIGGEPFTYIPVATANDVTASFVTSFFAAHLEADEAARELLRDNPWSANAMLDVRE